MASRDGWNCKVRGTYYSGNLSELKRTWERAAGAQLEVSATQRDIEDIPAPEDRVKQWFSEQPEKRILPVNPNSEWPEFEVLSGFIDRVEELCGRAEHFEKEVLPTAERDAEREKIWASGQLSEAIGLLPSTATRIELENIYNEAIADGSGEWKVDE